MATSIKTPVGNAPVIPVILIGAGFYLAWFGIHYWGSTTKWPTDPVKAVLTGKPVPAAEGNETTAVIAAEIEGTSGNNSSAASATPAAGGKYTLTDLQTLWTGTGGSSTTALAAANVAIAESAGDPSVTSPNPDGGTNVGLWQLDTKGVGAGFSVAQLQDPSTNALLTIMHTANGSNWSQWNDSVVHNGQYVGPKA